MTQRVQLPDGNVGEFPDTMSSDDIESVLQKQYPPNAHAQQEAAGVGKTPGFFKQLVAPYNPGAESFGEQHPVAGIPVRALDAAGGALLATPGAIYHAFADAPTPEEKARYAAGEAAAGEAPGTQTSGLKRIGLGVRRLALDPVAQAAQDYAEGKVTPAGALSVLPEALGVGVGSKVAGDVIGKAGETAIKTIGELRNIGKTGAGVQPTARKVTQVESEVKDAVKDAGAKQVADLEKNAAERTATVKDNLEKQRQANYDIARKKLAVDEANKNIAAENQAQADAVAQRQQLEQTVDQQSRDLGNKIESVENKVGKEADAKFNKVRQQVGNPETDPAPLTAAVRTAEEEDLQNIPENIKEFREILKHGRDVNEDPALADAARRHANDPGQLGEDASAALEEPEPMTWNKLQSLKSRIDTRLRQARTRPLNGDVKRALYRVQNQIMDTMGGLAEEAGAGDNWKDARDFYRQYKEDFYEPHGPSGSGSPVAQSFNAVDPAKIRQPFLGTARSTLGNRATDILRKYPEFGGEEAAGLADQMIQNHVTAQGLPKDVNPTALKTAPTDIKLPTNTPAPPIPPAPEVDIHKIATDQIAAKSKNWGSFNARDAGILGSSLIGGLIMGTLAGHSIGGGIVGLGSAIGYEGAKYALSRTLNQPAVIEWLARTPAEEVAALRKIPNAERVKIMDGLTQVAIKAGPQARLSPDAIQLLGPANLHKILAAGGGVSGQQIKNRKDALKALEPVAP